MPATVRRRTARIGIESTRAVQLLAVDTATWLRSLELPWDHRDPADRIIVATALLQRVPLVTVDPEIQRFDGIECIW